MSLGNKENQIDNKPETQDENQNFKKETDEDKKKKEQDTTQDNKDNVDNTDDEEKKKKKQDNEDDYVDNKKKKQCSLEEYEQKVQELNEQIFQLTKSLTEQQNLFNSMKDDFEKLSQFKKDIDKESKYKLINKFKMKNIISQDDIHNIEQKIDEYSYEELNNKLCCLYTSKMLDYEEDTNNFEEEEKNKKKMYNLNNSVPKDENTDSWENQVKARQKKN